MLEDQLDDDFREMVEMELDEAKENIEKIKQGYKEIYNTLQILSQLETNKKRAAY